MRPSKVGFPCRPEEAENIFPTALSCTEDFSIALGSHRLFNIFMTNKYLQICFTALDTALRSKNHRREEGFNPSPLCICPKTRMQLAQN